MRWCAFVIAIALTVSACSVFQRQWQNRELGDGWRLLASGTGDASGRAYQVQAATTDEEWGILWRTFDMTTPAPAVDLGSEIAVSFAEGIGSTCREKRLDDVVIDRGDRVVYSVTSDPLRTRGCTDDLVGVAFFVVALSRPSLPESPFTVRLRSTCIGPCNDGEEVTVDVEP